MNIPARFLYSAAYVSPVVLKSYSIAASFSTLLNNVIPYDKEYGKQDADVQALNDRRKKYGSMEIRTLRLPLR